MNHTVLQTLCLEVSAEYPVSSLPGSTFQKHWDPVQPSSLPLYNKDCLTRWTLPSLFLPALCSWLRMHSLRKWKVFLQFSLFLSEPSPELPLTSVFWECTSKLPASTQYPPSKATSTLFRYLLQQHPPSQYQHRSYSLSCCNRILSTGCLKNRCLFLLVLEAGESKMKVLTNSVPGESLLPGSQASGLANVYAHGRVRANSGLSLL